MLLHLQTKIKKTDDDGTVLCTVQAIGTMFSGPHCPPKRIVPNRVLLGILVVYEEPVKGQFNEGGDQRSA